MEKPALRIENLVKHHNSGFSLQIPQLEFQAGKIYGIIGPNGAGKTTLLNLLNLLETPSKGEIFFNGQKVTNSNTLDIRRRMNLIMENPYLFHTTVFKNITSGLKFRSVDKKMWPQLSAEALKMVGLEGFEKRHSLKLSRGEIQRVAIARALVLKPAILFLDEPFTNIDKKHVDIVEKLILSINRQYHTTIIFTTHDLWQAYRLADAVISLVQGKIVNGSLENLFVGEAAEVDGLQFVRISANTSLHVVTEKRGRVHICIPPQDIILSSKHIESSARNSFRGRIKTIQLEGQVVRLVINVDEGVDLTALITKASYEKMKPAVDSQLFLTFKSTSVTVF
jgi:molybdopterin-binding protein